jgi:hypothetical protein
MIDNMEAEDYWESYGDDAGSTVTSRFDTEMAHSGSSSLRIEYDIKTDGWGDTGFTHESPQDWSSGSGISLWLHSDGTGQPVALMLLSGTPNEPTPFTVHFETTAESAAGWSQFVFAWADFELASWADEGGLSELDPTQVVAMGFNFSPSQGILWVDDISLATGEIQPPPPAQEEQMEQEEPPPAPTTAPEQAPSDDEPESTESEGGGPCPSAAVLPLAAVGVVWVFRRRNS